MDRNNDRIVAVDRRIHALAADIFRLLADSPNTSTWTVPGCCVGPPPTPWSPGVGDVFVMKMHYALLGDYEMNNHVVEYELDRRIGWEPEAVPGTRS